MRIRRQRLRIRQTHARRPGQARQKLARRCKARPADAARPVLLEAGFVGQRRPRQLSGVAGRPEPLCCLRRDLTHADLHGQANRTKSPRSQVCDLDRSRTGGDGPQMMRTGLHAPTERLPSIVAARQAPSPSKSPVFWRVSDGDDRLHDSAAALSGFLPPFRAMSQLSQTVFVQRARPPSMTWVWPVVKPSDSDAR